MNSRTRGHRTSAAPQGNVLAVLLGVLLALPGCQQPSSGGFPVEKGWLGPRSVSVWGRVFNGPTPANTTTGVRPATIGVVPGSSVSDLDRGNYPYWSKVEIDFGDGSGWQDVTETYNADKLSGQPVYMLDYIQSDGMDPELCIKHTYTSPGSYTIDARVTYWDGEVVYAHSSSQTQDIMVTE